MAFLPASSEAEPPLSLTAPGWGVETVDILGDEYLYEEIDDKRDSVPAAPIDLQAAPSDGQVYLTWSAPGEDDSDDDPEIDHYIVYRDVAEIAQTSSTSYLDTGLTNWVTYVYTVAAHNDEGTGPQSAAVQSTPLILPGAPTDLQATPSDGQVYLTWSAPLDDGGAAIDHYIVYRDGADVGHPTALSFTDTGLVNGVEYSYTIAANNAGEGPQSSAVLATPFTVPGEPTDLQATPGNTQVSLSWTAPDDGGSAIDYYIIYRDGEYIDQTSSTSYIDDGLANGVSYGYTLAAHNAAGAGPQSLPKQVTPSTVPGAPTGLEATPGNAQVSLIWSAPLDDGGAAIDHYIVYRDGTDVGHPATASFSDSGLSNGVSYTYTVAAHNVAGISARSSGAQAIPLAVPSAPTDLQATPSNTQVYLAWSAPVDDGGSSIDYYVVYRDGEDIAHPSTLYYTDTGLINGETYSYTVAAHSIAGLGLQCPAVQATPLTVPNAPTGLEAAPGNRQVSLIWSAPGSDGGSTIDYYIVYRNGADVGHPTALSFTDTGLVNGVTYTYTVAAHNAAGVSAQSSPEEATPLAVPSVPIGLEAAPGNAQVYLTWSAPVDDGGFSIDYYVVYRDGVDIAHPTAPNFTDIGLVNGQIYSYSVAAHTAAGLGLQCPAVQATPFTVPGAPTGLLATPGNGQVDLSWSAPGSNGGSAIDYYVVYRDGMDVGHSSTLLFTDDGLISGVTYTYTVAAHNAAGIGPLSSSAQAVTMTVPGAPTGLVATPGNAQVSLTWSAPGSNGGSAIDYYVVYRDGTDIGHSTMASFTDSGLNNGVSYTYTVAAHNVVGIGAQSSPAHATPMAVPSAPTGLYATPSNAQVYLAWWAPVDDGGSSIDYYVVYRDGVDIAHPSTLYYMDTGLTNGETYSYTVAAHSIAGLGLQCPAVQATPLTVPNAPTGLVATPGNAQVSLIWSAPGNDGGSTIDYYIVYRNGADVGHPTALPFIDTGLTNGVAYTYTVAAHNAAGTGPQSASVSAVPGTFPAAPTGLVATPGNAQVSLTWSAPGSNGGSTIDYYVVYRDGTDVSHPTALSFTDMGLTNGMTYTYTVAAHNAAGLGAQSLPVQATPFTVPGAPTGLTATPGNAQVSLTWSAPSNNGGSAIDYYVVYRDGTDVGHPTALSFTDTGRVNGVTYIYTVAAHNAAGIGPQSSLAQAVPRTVPGAPTGLVATPGNAQVSLTWSAPGSNGGSAIDYYVVYRDGTDIGHPTALSFTDLGLINGETYRYTVAAHNAAGTGAQSSPEDATPFTVPGAPTGLTATPGNAQVSLSWSAPSSNGGSAIDYYIVYRDGVDVKHATALSFLDTGLTNGVEYTYKIAAHNAAGIGPQSTEKKATPFTVPGAPSGLIATPGNRQVSLTWTAPSSNGGSAIDYYVVYRDGTDVGHPTALSFTDTGRVNGVTYTYTVAAHNSAGLGALSTSVQSTPRTVPGVPTGLLATPGDAQVHLTWSAPGDDGGADIDHYVVYRNGTDVGHSTALWFTDTGLVNGVTYTYTVAAHNAAGTGAASTPVLMIPFTYPGAPTDIQATPGDAFVYLNWSAPEFDGGNAITNYQVWRGGSLGSETFLTDTGMETWFNDTGLTNGQTYYYLVRAENAAGPGVNSSEASVVPSPDTIPPSAPLNLVVTFGDEKVTLSWDPPANNGGSPVIGYKVYRSTVPGEEVHVDTIGNVEYVVNTGLINGQIYYFRMSALTSAGEGELSSEASATPAASPGPPYGLMATPGDAQVYLEWSAPEDHGAPILYYIVYRDGVKLASPTGTTYLSTGLTNGVSYTYTVAAANSAGIGPLSAPVTSTPYSVPGAPTNLTATAGNGKVVLDWSTPASDGGLDLDHYVVYLNGVEVGQTTDTTFTVTGLSNGVSYELTVAAHNSAGYGPLSSPLEATPRTLPGVPTGLRAIMYDVEVMLTWNAPEDDGGAPIDHYVVYRDGQYLANALNTNYSYLEQNEESHVYSVAAHNAAGIGNVSSPVALLFSQAPSAPGDLQAVPGNSLVLLTWSVPEHLGQGTVTYHLFRDGTEVWSGTSTNCADTGLVKGVSYNYTVVASNAMGWGEHSMVVAATAVGVPDAPGGLTAEASDGGTSLSWNVPAYVGPGTLTYHLYRDGVKIWYGHATSHVDTSNLTDGESHSYRVTASNSEGMGASSAVVTIKPISADIGGYVDILLYLVIIGAIVLAVVVVLVYLRRR